MNNYQFKLFFSIFILAAIFSFAQNKDVNASVWVPDNGDGAYKNPIINADYSDPDVIRVGDDYYLTSSSFVHTPGLPILHSKDLVNWEIINHVTANITYGNFENPMHGNGIWAPCIRYHNGEFYVYYGDPDYGIFMSKTKDPAGVWEPLKLVKEAKGWIDPSPFWDEDGSAYLVHAWAKSRSGIKHILTLHKMNSDGNKILDEGVLIYNGTEKHPTLEGPKMYKRNGYYYILAPAGGVPTGWQAAFRAKNIYGPYEDKIVMEQGSTNINGPHQGGWVETPAGESWFIHFQDKGAYGRVVHLQPMRWVNDWPVIGVEKSKPGCGEPINIYKKPDIGKSYPVCIPQTSDEFTENKLGIQWQWEANNRPSWYSLKENSGFLRLYSQRKTSDTIQLWDIPNICGQKFPSEVFTVTAKVILSGLLIGEKAGISVFGMDYCYLYAERNTNGYSLSITECYNANKNGKEKVIESVLLNNDEIEFKIEVKAGAICYFSYSSDGISYKKIGDQFTAKKGMWVGAKIGLFSIAVNNSPQTGFAEFDYLRFTK